MTSVEYEFLNVETRKILFMEGVPQERFRYKFKDGKMVLCQGDCEVALYNEMEAYHIDNDKKAEDWLILCEGVNRLGYDNLDDIYYIRFTKSDPADHDKITSFELRFNDDTKVTGYRDWNTKNLTPGSGVEAESYGNYVRFAWDKKDEQNAGEETPGELEFQYIDLSSSTGVSGHSDALILVRDGKAYQYNSNYRYCERRVANNYTEGSQELTETEAEKLLEKQNTVIEKMEEAFNPSGIEIRVNEESGIVRFDANILFAKSSADLSEEGKEILDSFAEVYARVMEEALK